MAEHWNDHTTLKDSDLFWQSDMDTLSHEDNLSNSGAQSQTSSIQVNNKNQTHINQPQQDENFKQTEEMQECVQSQRTSSQTQQQRQVITELENSPPQYEKVGNIKETCTRGSIALNFVHPDVSSNLSEFGPTTYSLPGDPGVSYIHSKNLRSGRSRAFNYVGDKSVADVQGIPPCDDSLEWALSGFGNANLQLPNMHDLEREAADAAAALQQLNIPGSGEESEHFMGNGQPSLDTVHDIPRAILSTDMENNQSQNAMQTDLPQNDRTSIRPQIAVENVLLDTFTSSKMVQNITTDKQPQVSTSNVTQPQASASDTPPQTSAPSDQPQASLSGVPAVSKAVSHDASTEEGKNSRKIGPNNKRQKEEERTDSTKKFKRYEQPPSDDPKAEKKRKDALRAKINRERAKRKYDKVEAENHQLRTLTSFLLQLLRHHNITIPQDKL